MTHSQETQQSERPLFMHPAIFIGTSVLIGILFALQEYLNAHRWGYQIHFLFVAELWGLQFLLWGIFCWIMWRFWRGFILRAGTISLLTVALPLSIVTSIVEEMIWVVFFPRVPLDRPPMNYWHRLSFQLDAELVDSMVIFWCAFLLFRGVAYYQKFREKETTAARLEVQLVQARLAALRMQLNPHFLFNAMNTISSLMRTDVEAADAMLEQLSSLLRISLERGEAQLVPMHKEIEFIEIYLAMQQQRYRGRVRQALSVDPELHDALVPALILQPIVENAYVHGLSRCLEDGELSIEIHRDGKRIRMSVVNSGNGLHVTGQEPGRHGVGLANVRDRLRLHYGDRGSLSIREAGTGRVNVTIALPLQIGASNPAEEVARFDA